MSQSFDLERFCAAQDARHGGGASPYETALAELTAGRKTSHWIWYVFPQIAGLGFSEMSQRYAVADLDEARAYLRHRVLGPRLLTCVQALLGHPGKSANAILGSPDDMKVRSCLTLFAQAGPAEPAFRRALDAFYDGKPDEETLRLLG